MLPVKTLWLATMIAFVAPLKAADLPTVTIEHLYYLQARADRVRRFKPSEMIDYCVAQKIGGSGFESLYSQLFTIRVDITKLVVVGELERTDTRVAALQKSSDAYTTLLEQEVQRVQSGIIREGQIATDALQAIARTQNSQ